MKICCIATFFNEEKAITAFLDSLAAQTVIPHEIILVDAGSTDMTQAIIKSFMTTHHALPIQLFIKKGNRSVGRNEAIRHATADIITCTDVGCILDNGWVAAITKPFEKADSMVVAGYYAASDTTPFGRALTPYVLIMPDNVDENHFLPATRSMAFRKLVWETLGGFPEIYAHNEDYVFARNIRQAGYPITFTRQAIVYWQPRENINQAFIMFFRFAYGDMEANIVRTKVVLLFIRYTVALIVVCMLAITHVYQYSIVLLVSFFCYIIWAISKNYRYMHSLQAVLWLPIIQITADIAVLSGSMFGLFNRRS